MSGPSVEDMLEQLGLAMVALGNVLVAKASASRVPVADAAHDSSDEVDAEFVETLTECECQVLCSGPTTRTDCKGLPTTSYTREGPLALTVVCAWKKSADCEGYISGPKENIPSRISHGLCEPCSRLVVLRGVS